MQLSSTDNKKIIYLDQKGWINLTKIAYGEPSLKDKDILDKIITASEKETAIFPISMINLGETNTISDNQRRKQLATIMAKISKGYTLTPYWPKIIDIEIENMINEVLGLPEINIKEHWLGKGVTHLMGVKPTIVTEDKFSQDRIKDLQSKLDQSLLLPETIELFLSDHTNDQSLKQDRIQAVENFEKSRIELLKIKDNNLRFRAFLGINTLRTIIPRLDKVLKRYNLEVNFMEQLLPDDGIFDFLAKLPTAMCELYLLYNRDQQLQRPIEVNDVADIWHLTLAIPYSDIVITENMWTSICQRTKIDVKCNTVVLNSIHGLNHYL